MTNKIGTVKIEGVAVGAGISGLPLEIPIYQTAEDDSSENLRIAVNGGVGFIPHTYYAAEHTEFFDTSCRFTDPASNEVILIPPENVDITFSGLGGDFSTYNGTTQLEYRKCKNAGLIPDLPTPLSWGDSKTSDPRVSVAWYSPFERWYVDITSSATCHKTWYRDDPSPFGSYTESACNDSGCTDGDTCYKSSGATCSVSEV